MDENPRHSCSTNTFNAASYLEQLSLSSQPFSAELHDRVGAEGVPDAVLTERAQPQRQAALQLEGRNQDRLVTWVDAERPNARERVTRRSESESSGVWIDGVAVRFTLRGTTKQNPDRSRDPGRWLFGGKSRVHTAALWSDTVHWPLHEISGRSAPKRSSAASHSEATSQETHEIHQTGCRKQDFFFFFAYKECSQYQTVNKRKCVKMSFFTGENASNGFECVHYIDHWIPVLLHSGNDVPHLYTSQHACGWHTEVQIGNHLRCRRLVHLRRPTARKIVWQQVVWKKITLQVATRTVMNMDLTTWQSIWGKKNSGTQCLSATSTKPINHKFVLPLM